MIKSLSILIPAYNSKCYPLVAKLHELAERAEGLDYEIIVADDGSRDQVSILSNQLINELSHCRYIRRTENVGRSKIRNFLADEARGEWLLFLDCDVKIISDNFLRNYLNPQADVVSGRTKIIPCPDKKNLRCKYETAWAAKYNAEKLNKMPYRNFVTANFLCRRSIFSVCRFDERYTTYGFEDVAFGISLQENHFSIVHISNPVGLDHFDANTRYMQKIEESLRTLHSFRNELRGYSQVLAATEHLSHLHLLWLLRIFHRLFGKFIRHILTTHYPSLFLLKVYKMGYYAGLAE